MKTSLLSYGFRLPMSRFALFLLLSLLNLALPSHAEEALRVTGSTLHAEGEKGEICLTVSKPLRLADRAALAAALHLTKDGTKLPVAARDLSLTPQEVCVQQLEHRRPYHLAVKGLRGAGNETQAEPFTLDFTLPDRKPKLSFAALNATETPLPNLTPDEPLTLQALNVKGTRLRLFRIADRAQFAAAWPQAQQLRLAPSESLYFATKNGQALWESELALNATPNADQEVTLPVPHTLLIPGLYFLAATPQDGLMGKASNTALMAGLWFRVGGLHLQASKQSDGVHVVAASADLKPLPDVALQLLTRDGEVLAEAKSNAEGLALLAVAREQKAEGVVVTGVAASGAPDMIDLRRASEMSLPPHASLQIDKTLYAPGSVATATLLLRDAQGAVLKPANSSLKLLRPDQSFFSEQKVPDEKAEPVRVAMPLPVTPESGVWTLLWQQADGQVLARQSLRLSPDSTWPKLEMTTDRANLDANGDVLLTLKAVDEQGHPLAGRSGVVTWQPTQPEFPAWGAYRFGVNLREAEEAKPTPFLTDMNGMAHVRLHAVTEDHPHALRFSARLDGVEGEAATLTLPVQSGSAWVGVRSLMGNRPFPENSIARFAIVALDATGKRRTGGELYYHVYEEGRSFTWFADEGRWRYQPLPQHRRIGGGRVSLTAKDSLITWPVTAGHYALELRNPEGAVLAQYPFDAGWNPTALTDSEADRLTLDAPEGLKAKEENNLIFKLSQPALVSLIVSDDQVRQTLVRSLPEGESRLPLTPGADWGQQVKIEAQALFANGETAILHRRLAVEHPENRLTLSASLPQQLISGQTVSFPVRVQNSAPGQATLLIAQATPLETATPSVIVPAMPVAENGETTLRFDLPPVSGSLRLTVTAWNAKQEGQMIVTLPARPALDVTGTLPSRLMVGDRVPFTFTISNEAAEGRYTYILASPSGLKRTGASKGTLALKAGQRRSVTIDLAATKAGQDAVRLEVTGPSGSHRAMSWPVEIAAGKAAPLILTTYTLVPNQSVTLPLKPHSKGEALTIVTPVPWLNRPQALQALLSAEPFTTFEMAERLEALRLSQNTVKTLGLRREESLKRERTERLRQLQMRKNDDGGFKAQPDSTASDLASTAAAVIALSGEAPAAAEQAVLWLQRKLDNGWFNEEERPARAAALLALSKLGRADVSALRYFADTSRDKPLPPLTSAQLSLALALNKDEIASRFWLQKAREGLDATKPDAWEILTALTAHPLLDPRELRGDLERAAPWEAKATLRQTSALLQGTETLSTRLGTWRLAINKAERKHEGMAALPPQEKNATLSNPSDTPLYVAQIEPGTSNAPAPSVTLQRHLYHLDGAKLADDESLKRDSLYLLVLRGTGNAAQLHVPTGGGLEALPTRGDAKLFPALAPLTSWNNGELSPSGLNLTLTPAQNWRIALLVQPTARGTFALPPVVVRDGVGAAVAATQNAVKIRVE